MQNYPEIAENNFSDLGDTSTLADPGVVDNLVENTNEQESRIVNKKQFTTLNPREFK